MVDDDSGRPDGAGDLRYLEVSTDGETVRVHARAVGLDKDGDWRLTVAARDSGTTGVLQLSSDALAFAGPTLASTAADQSVLEYPPADAVQVVVDGDAISADIPVGQLPAGISEAQLAAVLTWRPAADPADTDDFLSNFLSRQSYDACPEQADARALIDIGTVGEHPDTAAFGSLSIRRPAPPSTDNPVQSSTTAAPDAVGGAESPSKAHPSATDSEAGIASALLAAWNAADPAAAAMVASDDAVRFMFSEPTNRDARLLRCRHFSEVPDGEYQAFATAVCDGTFTSEGLGEQTVELYLDGGASAGYAVTAVSFNRNPPSWRPAD